MDKKQRGHWATGNGYGGGVRSGTYEEYLKDTWLKGEFMPDEREIVSEDTETRTIENDTSAKKLEKETEEKREARRKEIEESTDPTLDEVVTMSWRGHPNVAFGGAESYSMQITKREKMLIDEGFVDKLEMYKEKQEKRYKDEAKAERRAKAERIGEIMLSKDPKMDEKVMFNVYDSKEDTQDIINGTVFLGSHYYHSVMRYRKTETIVDRRCVA